MLLLKVTIKRTIKHTMSMATNSNKKNNFGQRFCCNKVIQSLFKYGIIKIDASSIIIIITMTCVHKHFVVKGYFSDFAGNNNQFSFKKIFIHFFKNLKVKVVNDLLVADIKN